MRGGCVHAGAERVGATDDPTARYVSLCWCPFCGSIAVEGKWRAPSVLAERDDAVRLLAKLRDWTDEEFGACLLCRGEREDGMPCADRLRAEELCKGVTP